MISWMMGRVTSHVRVVLSRSDSVFCYFGSMNVCVFTRFHNLQEHERGVCSKK